jgi:hypothetical protein
MSKKGAHVCTSKFIIIIIIITFYISNVIYTYIKKKN